MVAEFQVFRRRTRHAPIYGLGILTLLVGYATKRAAPGGARW